MTSHISISTSRLQTKLGEMRSAGFTAAFTTDIIEFYMGEFHSNTNVPAAYSWNAQFGKYLKANSQQLGIIELEAKVHVKVNGHSTSASRWSLSPQS